ATEELGFSVVGLGTYSREQAREVRAAAKRYGVDALITEDHLEVEEQIEALHPELVLGTQMERHIAKRLGLPCAIISAPVHVHDYPARYSPQMGFEGANVLFDTWVHPLMMGLEEHLLAMFRDDFEFRDGVAPSHLGGGKVGPTDSEPASATRALVAEPATDSPTPSTQAQDPAQAPAANRAPDIGAPAPSSEVGEVSWTTEAQKELKKIPFFVRGKARRNTEHFARERGFARITLETLYDAKAHFQA
ncbi:MAG: nitrogenase component 1, partial [Myxococcota bacterium]